MKKYDKLPNLPFVIDSNPASPGRALYTLKRSYQGGRLTISHNTTGWVSSDGLYGDNEIITRLNSGHWLLVAEAEKEPETFSLAVGFTVEGLDEALAKAKELEATLLRCKGLLA